MKYTGFYNTLKHKERVVSPRISSPSITQPITLKGKMTNQLYNHIVHAFDADIMKANNAIHRNTDGDHWTCGYQRASTLEMDLHFAQKRAEEFYNAFHPDAK